MGRYLEKRLKLHDILVNIMGEKYKDNVYFNPPSQIKYPCIIYSLGTFSNKKADGIKYKNDDRYSVMLIHNNYTNEFVDKLNELEYCEFDRHYPSDNLHHFVYSIYIN